MKYDIFISYKSRGTSKATAAYLYDMLLKKGYSVFYDRKEMRSGKFNEQLLEHISSAKDIFILLEEGSLDSWFKFQKPFSSVITGEGVSPEDLLKIKDLAGQMEAPYKTDWFCREIMHALSIGGKNIIPILLDGYCMPDGKDLPPEMAELSLHNAVSLDIGEIEEFYKSYLLDKEYLKSKPQNLAISRQYQRGTIVASFLFYTNAASCELYECGERIITLTSDNDEDHPFRYPVSYAGEHRFLLVNNETCEEQRIKQRIETSSQEYIPVEWQDTQSIWGLTCDQIEEQTDIDVLFRWGRGLFQGNSIHTPDVKRATLCFKRAVVLGDQRPKDFALEHMEMSGLSITDEERFIWYDFLSTLDVRKELLFQLGLLYYYDCGVAHNVENAVNLFTKAAERGSADAQNFLGIMYEFGHGVVQSDEKALELLTMAADQGHAVAQNNLANMYREGHGVEQNYQKAVALFASSSVQGNAAAQCNLANMYQEGHGVGQSYEKAARLYAMAAGKGNAAAQCNLAILYFHGHGVEQDYEKAVELYTKAACQGNATAQSLLANMYVKGLGVAQCYEKAAELYSKASDQGNVAAQCNLANMYLYGIGVVQSLEKAYELFSQAANKGVAYAYNGLSYAYSMMDQMDNALDAIENAIKLEPRNSKYIDSKGEHLLNMGRTDEALEMWKKAMELGYEYESHADSALYKGLLSLGLIEPSQPKDHF